MRTRRMAEAFFLAAVVWCLSPVGARPQAQADSLSRVTAARSDTSFVPTPFQPSISLTDRFQQNTARPLSSYLGVSPERFYGWKTYELSHYECVLGGADMGMTFGLIAGAAGMSTGAWDERTAWYVAGAAAALGAIFGSKVLSNDPQFRVRLRWEASDHDPWQR
jgi:hypothetical protein